MATDRTFRRSLHPLHAVLLAGTIPLFLGALLSDYAYSSTYYIQWATFASWLLAGGLVFAGLALLWAIIGLIRPDHRRPDYLAYIALLVATWIVGFLNALIHARDAWGMMPTGMILSIVMTLLACAATWIAFSRLHAGGQA